MVRLADLAAEARSALIEGDAERFGRLLDANFDVRRSICRLPAGQTAMVDRARSVGATAHFAGSGGAIVGTYPNDAVFSLGTELGAIGCRVLRPTTLG